MKNNFILCCLSLLTNFFGFGGTQEDPEVAEGKRFLKKVEYELKKINYTRLDSFGGYNSLIFEFNFGFVKKTKNINEDIARRLFIEMTEKIYELINKEKSLIPFLEKFPYDEKVGFILLTFKDEKNNDFTSSDISYVSLDKGILEYGFRGKNGLEKMFRESYSTAYEKVMGKPLIDRRVMYGIEAIEETKQ